MAPVTTTTTATTVLPTTTTIAMISETESTHDMATPSSSSSQTSSTTATAITTSATTSQTNSESVPITTSTTSAPTSLVTTIAADASMAPSRSPVAVPSTFAPTTPWDRSVVSFVVTAGTWDERIDPALVLPRLPVRQARSFVVHLGDWNARDESNNCDEQQYEDVSALWSQSSSPVYFVVGNAETNECPNPDQALTLWRNTLTEYHERFWARPPWTFWDDNSAGYPDVWVFDTNRIAVVGLHLTAGAETNGGRRPASVAALEWIDVNYDFYRRRDLRRMVLLANAAVDDVVHASFFETLLERLGGDYADMQFVWIQPGKATAQEISYQGLENFDVVTVQRNVWPPMRIQIDGNANVFIDQNDWFDNLTGLHTTV